MTRQASPGGTRRPNNTGSIRKWRLRSGELRYHASLRGKFVGSFETLAAAQRALEAALAQESAGVERG
jgi:hypothetical protein